MQCEIPNDFFPARWEKIHNSARLSTLGLLTG